MATAHNAGTEIHYEVSGEGSLSTLFARLLSASSVVAPTGRDRTCRIQLAGLRGIRQYPRSWAQGGRGAVIGDPTYGWDGRESQ